MIKKILVSFILLVLLNHLVSAKTVLNKAYLAKQIAPNVWVIHGPMANPSPENQGFMNNPAFIISDKSVIVIDPGSSFQTGQMVLNAIEKITSKPVTHVLNTHIHGDHWLGNDAIYRKYPQAHFYAHPKMIKAANDYAAKEWLDIMIKATDGFSKDTKAVIPSIPLTQADTLTVDNIKFKIYATEKAHSDTDIMIAVVDQKVLFLGDNVTHQRFGRLTDATFAGNIKACQQALATNSQIFVAGHGPTGGKEVVQKFKAYLEQVYQLAAQYYDKDLADYEMKPLIIKALPDYYKTWAGFDDQIGKHIIKAVQEIENNAF